ncbi:tRNA (cytidine(34)-2'-O)-methyltransferase [uncultured archaeon]|nr:tRNA (cytidine(34)-2'-O)-methyltransferase [uncultured archaeon]
MKRKRSAKKGRAEQLKSRASLEKDGILPPRIRVQRAAPSVSQTASASSSGSMSDAFSFGKRTSRFRIVLVEPEYELNLGSVARAMKNFGFSELVLVRPKCNPLGFDAIKYSKHARDVLEMAKTVKTLAAASKGCKFTVGTSGILYRHWHETFRTPISLRQFAEKMKGEKEGGVALVFGNEGVGLSEKDISACDFLVTIPTSKEYPILNLSHAVAVALYELSSFPLLGFTPAGEMEKEALIKSFSLIVGHYSSELRNAKKVNVAFRRMVGKSMLTDKECAAILGVLRRAEKDLQKKRG